MGVREDWFAAKQAADSARAAWLATLPKSVEGGPPTLPEKLQSAEDALQAAHEVGGNTIYAEQARKQLREEWTAHIEAFNAAIKASTAADQALREATEALEAELNG